LSSCQGVGHFDRPGRSPLPCGPGGAAPVAPAGGAPEYSLADGIFCAMFVLSKGPRKPALSSAKGTLASRPSRRVASRRSSGRGPPGLPNSGRDDRLGSWKVSECGAQPFEESLSAFVFAQGTELPADGHHRVFDRPESHAARAIARLPGAAQAGSTPAAGGGGGLALQSRLMTIKSGRRPRQPRERLSVR
jgi:hypothetical protein